MSRVLTGDKLISSIRSRAMIPEDSSAYTDDNILDIANEELDVQLLENLLTLHEEHLTVHIDVPRNAEGVYDIPYRAIGNKLRDVQLLTDGGQIYEMTQVGIGSLSDYTFDGQTQGEGFDKFYIESNQINMIQPNRGYDKLRIYFYIRPSFITKVDKSGVIQSIQLDNVANTVTYTFNTIPNAFNPSQSYDIVGARTPNKIKVWDIQPVQVDNLRASITFNQSDLSDINPIQVGDYVCIAEQSPVPNIPTEMHPLLAQYTAIHILEALNDSEGLANATRRVEKMEKSVMGLVDDRVELAPRKIKPRNGTLAETRYGRFKRRRGR